MGAPILFRWSGEAMVPLPRFHNAVNAEFVVGEVYPLVVEAQRSTASHNHFFAAVADLWANLPETIAHRWPTPEHLRKFALVQTGFRDERTHVCASKAEAQRLRAFAAPLDEYAVVVVHEATVVVMTAKSQSRKAMGAADFQRSKTAVLDYVSDLIGLPSRGTGERAA